MRSEAKTRKGKSLSPEEAARRIEASKNPKPAESIPDNAIDIVKAVEKRVQSEQATLPRCKPLFDSAAILNAYQLNEAGDAWIYTSMYRGEIVYDHAAKAYYVWQDHYWQEDKCDKVMMNFAAVISVYAGEVAKLEKQTAKARSANDQQEEKRLDKIRKEFVQRIWWLNTPKRRESVLKFVRTGENLGVTGDNFWDMNPMLLGCPNCVIDLKTGQSRPGQPEDYIKTITKAEWKGIDEPCPTWERFISEIFDGDTGLARYVQRLFGYAITGKTTEHFFFILQGGGRNGKGTLFETMKRHVLGDLAETVSVESLLDPKMQQSGSHHTSDLMKFRGKRIVWSKEATQGRKFQMGRVKELTGGDTISAREIHAKQTTFTPTHKLFFQTNYKPKADPADYAFWMRVHLIPFELSFVDEPKEAFERKKDKDLSEKLKAEASGILAWLVRGCLEWQENGLNPPDKVKAATSEYRKDEDSIGQFIEDQCEIGLPSTDKEIQSNALYMAYKLWCESSGNRVEGHKSLTLYLKSKFSIKSRHGRDANYYIGIDLLRDEKPVKGEGCEGKYILSQFPPN